MRGYVAQRRNRFYAVIYEGIDPITGRERRRWHPAGTDKERAEKLASALAAAQSHRVDGRRAGPTFGVYLTSKWLPAKQLTLRPSTWDGYRRLIELHVLPHLGRIPLDICERSTSTASTPPCSNKADATAPAALTPRPSMRSIS